MSQQLISRSPDLQRLRSDGYDIEVRSGHLLVKDIPYVTANRTLSRGMLVSTLELAGDVTAPPSDHVARFAGEMPCDANGHPLVQIEHAHQQEELAEGLTVNHSFSSKPSEGYADYHEKMSTYASIISRPARSIDESATANTFRIVQSEDENSVFEYIDTASSRAGIGAITAKLAIDKVAIVGLGGTGSYILDFIAKTPVVEIHLFDNDRFGQHNAFRSPGAPSLEDLQAMRSKEEHFAEIYSRMRRNLVVHGHFDRTTANELRGMDFVFLAIDSGYWRKVAVEVLEGSSVPFIDVGMGLAEVEGSLLGQLRTTAVFPETQDRTRMPLSDTNENDDYSRNIQIVELNALNAALAVVKWKKLVGFYADVDVADSAYYQIDGNCVINANARQDDSL